MSERVAAELRVGGPVIVKWPDGNPAITRVSQAGEFISLWVETTSIEKPERARFMVLQDHDTMHCPGVLVGIIDMPWFGRCRVFRLPMQ